MPAVYRFPVLERDIREPNTNSIERARSSVPVSSNTKLQEHNHNREVIFALPSLQLHFKTDHMQPTTPDVTRKLDYLYFNFNLIILLFFEQKKNQQLSVASLLNLRIISL